MQVPGHIGALSSARTCAQPASVADAGKHIAESACVILCPKSKDLKSNSEVNGSEQVHCESTVCMSLIFNRVWSSSLKLWFSGLQQSGRVHGSDLTFAVHLTVVTSMQRALTLDSRWACWVLMSALMIRVRWGAECSRGILKHCSYVTMT